MGISKHHTQWFSSAIFKAYVFKVYRTDDPRSVEEYVEPFFVLMQTLMSVLRTTTFVPTTATTLLGVTPAVVMLGTV